MAVTQLRQFPDRSGPSGEDNDRAEREYTELYLALSNSLADNAATILAGATALGLPAVFSGHPSDAGAHVVSRRPRRTDEGRVWEIEVQYSTKTEDPAQGGTADPLARTPEISFSFQKYQRPLVRDLGLPGIRGPEAARNSARQPFDPAPAIDDSRPILTVSRYEPSFDPLLALQYKDAVNSDLFFGSASGIWKVTEISARVTVENGQVVQRVNYSFEGRPETWRLKVLDQGMGMINKTTGKFEAIKDDFGASPAQPVLLNGVGQPLAESGTVLTSAVDAAVTSLPVDSTDTFPPLTSRLPSFQVRCGEEIMTVTNQTATTLTVTRGQEGTTASAHSAGAVVRQEPFYLEFRVYPELPFAALGLE